MSRSRLGMGAALLFWWLILLSTPSALRAQGFDLAQMPRDLAQADFYLVTIGRGEAIEARFGHTILRVVDRVSGADYSFNWGIFDYDVPFFALKFYIGNLQYMLSVTNSGDLLRQYRIYEKRRYAQQKINLTTKQKSVLMQRLLKNAQPENIYYRYDQFFDNCATRLRDHLDVALAGALKRQTAPVLGAANFRYYIRAGTDGSWWSYLGLDMLANNLFDRPINQWEEMFLPSMLAKRVGQMPAFDDQGRAISGRTLLGTEEILADFPEPRPGMNPYFSFGLALALLATAGTLAGGRFKGRLAGLSLAVFGFWSTAWGSVMTLNWLVSHHEELAHNASLWFFWPIDGLFMAAGGIIFVGGYERLSPRLAALCRHLATAHMAALVIFVGLIAFGFITQQVLPTLASFAPTALLLYGSCWRRIVTPMWCLASEAERHAA